jgi:hypothetical protein
MFLSNDMIDMEPNCAEEIEFATVFTALISTLTDLLPNSI